MALGPKGRRVVLDLGCGRFPPHYSPNSNKVIVGIDNQLFPSAGTGHGNVFFLNGNIFEKGFDPIKEVNEIIKREKRPVKLLNKADEINLNFFAFDIPRLFGIGKKSTDPENVLRWLKKDSIVKVRLAPVAAFKAGKFHYRNPTIAELRRTIVRDLEEKGFRVSVGKQVTKGKGRFKRQCISDWEQALSREPHLHPESSADTSGVRTYKTVIGIRGKSLLPPIKRRR